MRNCFTICPPFWRNPYINIMFFIVYKTVAVFLFVCTYKSWNLGFKSANIVKTENYVWGTVVGCLIFCLRKDTNLFTADHYLSNKTNWVFVYICSSQTKLKINWNVNYNKTTFLLYFIDLTKTKLMHIWFLFV